MKFLPFEKFVIKADTTKERAILAIDDSIEVATHGPFDSLFSYAEMFTGYTLTDDTFNISLTDNRKYPRLKIKGAVTETNKGCEIKGKIRYSLYYYIQYGIPLIALFFFGLLFTASLFTTHQYDKVVIGIYIAISLLYFFILYTFNKYKRHAIEKLAARVDGTIVADSQ